MVDPLSVSPDELRRTSKELASDAESFRDSIKWLRTSADSLGDVWGHDALGRSFAEGLNGYVAQHDSVFTEVDAVTALLNFYADVLERTAVSLQEQDIQNVLP